MTSEELIKLLKLNGWRHVSTHGSHHKFVHAETGKSVVVPHPKKHLAVGTVRAILRQANLKGRG
ncbi:addiction module toxin, HicA family [Duganella sp. FT109W]|uniref:Addiction module toxin, HicA family n=1 Tax=Duganella margarita TaxID=2692170 RepID=A0ABW9WCV2_9BURK|nr:type II toxin-antitoxin system HicA family toxin [Duganella margarita]MYN38877.1 addiction module toxin, HicA family [Duganella margarita]